MVSCGSCLVNYIALTCTQVEKAIIRAQFLRMTFYGEAITCGLLFLHTLLFFWTLSRLASEEFGGNSGCCSRIWHTFRQRAQPLTIFILHILDVCFDVGVIVGWLIEIGFFGDFNELSMIPIVGLISYVLSHIVTSYYVYSQTGKNDILYFFFELFDFSLYYGLYKNPENFIMFLERNPIVEQFYRGYATIESFPMCILQCYSLVAYTQSLTLFDKWNSNNSDGLAYVTLTFFSLIFSFLYIIVLFVSKDGQSMDVEHYPSVNTPLSPRWSVRVLFRIFEILSRVMLLTFCWLIYGPLCIGFVLILDYLFILYNYYGQPRTLEKHLLYCFPYFSDQMISFYFMKWRLTEGKNSKLKQSRRHDPVDWIQGWYFAYKFWNFPRLLYALKLKPQCDCSEVLQEYWTPLKKIKEMQRTGRESIGTHELELARCSSCDDVITGRTDICSWKRFCLHGHKKEAWHYFRCSKFLTQSSPVLSEAYMPSHGRHYCSDCGFARIVPFLPFLFVMSRNVFGWFYITLIIVLQNVTKLECKIGCNSDIDRGNIISDTQEPIFMIGMISHVLYPLFFLLTIRLRIIQNYFRKELNFQGTVISTIKSILNSETQNWNMFEEFLNVNFQNESIDINETDDENGFTALLYAAREHQFDIMKELIERHSANLYHRDHNNNSISDILTMPHERDKFNAATRVIKSGNALHLEALMLEYGCDMNEYDGFGNTPLIMCAIENDSVLMNEMLSCGDATIDIDKARQGGMGTYTQYMESQKMNRKGNDTSNEQNETPTNDRIQKQLSAAMESSEDSDIAQMQKEEPASPASPSVPQSPESTTNKKGRKRKNSRKGSSSKPKANIPETALLIAGELGHIDCVKILLEHGADTGASKYPAGKNPIVQRIYDSGHKECARLIFKQIGNSKSGKTRSPKYSKSGKSVKSAGGNNNGTTTKEKKAKSPKMVERKKSNKQEEELHEHLQLSKQQQEQQGAKIATSDSDLQRHISDEANSNNEAASGKHEIEYKNSNNENDEHNDEYYKKLKMYSIQSGSTTTTSIQINGQVAYDGDNNNNDSGGVNVHNNAATGMTEIVISPP